MMAIREIRRLLRQMEGKLKTEFQILHWQNVPAQNKVMSPFRVHLLVVKNRKYAKFAQICATSFLHHHPNSTVVIHVDFFTQTSVQKWVTRSKFHQAINVELIPDSDIQDSWQVQKMNLVLGISGTFDFFVDADMRWNGPLVLDVDDMNALFFVEEYKILENKTLARFIECPEFQKYSDASMWNTSFIHFSGFLLSGSQKREILELQEEIVNFVSHNFADDDLSSSIIRISEQLAISLAASTWNIPIKGVKKFDGYKDGAFLESSYFGATGTHF